MRNKFFGIFILLTFMIIVGASCNQPGARAGVSDITNERGTETDADWSARDLGRVARYMARSIKESGLGRRLPRKIRWMLAKELANDTAQHINTRVIMEKIRTQLIRKRLARFIDDQALDDILREQSLSQSALFDTRKAVKIGKLVGARLILRGRISSIRKRSANVDIVYYNITLTIVDLQTREIIWTDEKEMARRHVKGTFR